MKKWIQDLQFEHNTIATKTKAFQKKTDHHYYASCDAPGFISKLLGLLRGKGRWQVGCKASTTLIRQDIIPGLKNSIIEETRPWDSKIQKAKPQLEAFSETFCPSKLIFLRKLFCLPWRFWGPQQHCWAHQPASDQSADEVSPTRPG